MLCLHGEGAGVMSMEAAYKLHRSAVIALGLAAFLHKPTASGLRLCLQTPAHCWHLERLGTHLFLALRLPALSKPCSCSAPILVSVGSWTGLDHRAGQGALVPSRSIQPAALYGA